MFVENIYNLIYKIFWITVYTSTETWISITIIPHMDKWRYHPKCNNTSSFQFLPSRYRKKSSDAKKSILILPNYMLLKIFFWILTPNFKKLLQVWSTFLIEIFIHKLSKFSNWSESFSISMFFKIYSKCLMYFFWIKMHKKYIAFLNWKDYFWKTKFCFLE